MVYAQDDKAIRDAQEALDDATYEQKLQALNDAIDDYDDQIEALNDSYEKQIEAIQKIQNEWKKVAENVEKAKNDAMLVEQFGSGAWEKILSGELTPTNSGYIDDYLGVLVDLAGTDGQESPVAAKLAELYGKTLPSVSEEVQNIGKKTEETEQTFETQADKMVEKIDTGVIPAINREKSAMDEFNKSADLDIQKTVEINYETNGQSVTLPTGIAAANGYNNDLIGEAGREIWVHSDDGTYEVVDDPSMVDLKPNDIVLNHKQTEEVLKHKKGRAFANGNSKYIPLQDANPEKYAMFTRISASLTGNNGLVNMISDLNSNIKKLIDAPQLAGNNGANITFGDINVNCTGVTTQEVVHTISDTLEKQFAGLALSAYQRSKK